MAATDNWYLVLELEFDPPVNDEAVIAAKIEEKRKFWSTKYNDFKNGAQYKKWVEGLAQIKKDMIGPENKRVQLAREAAAEAYGEIDKILKMISKKGFVTPEEITNTAKKLGKSEQMVQKRVQALKIKKEQGSNIDYKKYYEQHYKAQPQNANKFLELPKRLDSAKKKDLYDFLYDGTNVKNAASLPSKALLERAKEKRGEFRGNDAVSSNGQKLCGLAEMAFNDEKSKKEYDSYRQYLQRREILEELKMIASISGKIPKTQWEDSARKMTQILKDAKLAENVVVSFMEMEKFDYEKSGNEQKQNIKVCRCGFANDVSDGRNVCAACGLPLTIKCPNCGTGNDITAKFCKCRFDFANLDQAVAFCELADAALQDFNFTVAENYLKDAERCWKDYDKIKTIRARLESWQKSIGAEVQKLRSAMDAKNFYEAQTLYATIRKSFPNFSDAKMEAEIKTAVEQAKTFFASAKAAKLEKDALDFYNKAFEACHDYPGVAAAIPKPQAPVNIKVTADGKTRVNVISWSASTSAGTIFYKIVRKRDAMPMNPQDGDTLARVSMCSYTDSKIQAGVCYYYAIFAERAGVYSDKALITPTPIVNCFEIKNLAVTIGDGSLALAWDTPGMGATVHIFEISAGGLEKKIKELTASQYLVTGLKNGTAYKYRVALSYLVNGKQELTRGEIITGTPDCPPSAVEILSIKADKNDEFIAVWEHTGEGEIRLYSSMKRPNYNMGDVVAVSALEQQMQPLQVKHLPRTMEMKPNQNSVSFTYSSENVMYVAAVTVKSGSAVFGAVARACKSGSVTIKEVREINEQIYLYIEPPVNATAFVVLHSFDHMPIDVSERVGRTYISKKEFDREGALVVPRAEKKKYNIAVFAEFRRGGECDYSVPVNYVFNNAGKSVINFSVSVEGFFSKKIALTFESSTPGISLPEIDVVCEQRKMPFKYDATKVIHSIPAQPLDKKLKITIPMPPGRDNHIKPFIKNAADGVSCELRKTGGEYKVN